MRRHIIALGLTASLFGCSQSATPTSPSTPTNVVAGDPNGGVALPDGPKANGPWVGAAAGNDAFVAGMQETFVAVWVDVPAHSEKQGQAPAAVALVIDTSGSMGGDKIKHAREGAQRLVESLRDGDIVSLHTFSDAVQERVAPVRLDSRSRQQVASIIAELRAEGGTNLFEGVRAAGMAAMAAPASHSIRRVVLISDGNATVGNTSTEMISLLGEKAADRSVQITGIGVGLDYNEHALNQLAIRSSGRLYHVTDSKVLPEIVQSEIALLKSTRAANARIAVVPAPGVELLSVDGARSMNQNGTLEIPLGSMFAGQHRELIVRARVNVPSEGSHPIASVRLQFSDPTEGNLERVQEAVARFDVVGDARVASSRRNLKAQGVLAMLDASRTTSMAAADIDGDRFGDAEKRLEEAERNLRAAAQQATNKQDKMRFEASAGRVSAAKAGASAAAAAPPAARAETKRKKSLEANDAAMDLGGF